METASILYVGDTPVQITHKAVRHMYLRVSRTDASVSVTAPLHTSLETVRRFVESREAWIARQLTRCAPAVNAVPEGFVRHLGAVVSLESLCGDTPARGRAAVLQALEKRVLHDLLAACVAHWQERLGVQPAGWRVRRMKSRWGSCLVQKRILCFNAHLVHYDRECIEYVVVHELAHLRVPGHGPAFWHIVEGALPDWKERRKKLRF